MSEPGPDVYFALRLPSIVTDEPDAMPAPCPATSARRAPSGPGDAATTCLLPKRTRLTSC
jgi:hypothetical protein